MSCCRKWSTLTGSPCPISCSRWTLSNREILSRQSTCLTPSIPKIQPGMAVLPDLTSISVPVGIERSMRDSVKVIAATEKDFADRFGRSYPWYGRIPVRRCRCYPDRHWHAWEEPEVAIDILRKEGIKAGSMRLRWFRPLPKLNLAGKRSL